MEKDEELIRKSMEFFGQVQGVGFRYRAVYAALHVGVTGWVKNNPDDSVSMEIQGTAKQINKVLDMINQGRFIEIQNVKEKILPVDRDERGFYSLD